MTVSVSSISRLVFVIEMYYVFCEVQTVFKYNSDDFSMLLLRLNTTLIKRQSEQSLGLR